MITSDISHSSFVNIAKKVSESIAISSYEENKKLITARKGYGLLQLERVMVYVKAYYFFSVC